MRLAGQLAFAALAALASTACDGGGGPGGGGPDAAPDTIDARGGGAPPDARQPEPTTIRLTHVTDEMPLIWNYGAHGSGVAVADLDADGDLDLAIADGPSVALSGTGHPSTILWNDGPSGAFVALRRDETIEALLAEDHCNGADSADVDQDGDVDVFFACFEADYLLENDGAGHFTDVAVARGLDGPPEQDNTAPVFADVNQDGLIDLYLLTLGTAEDPARERPNRLYLGRGGGRFEDVTTTVLAGYGVSYAALIANLDDDPALEIFVANDRLAVAEIGGFADLQGNAHLDQSSIDADGVPVFADLASDTCDLDASGLCHAPTGGMYASMGVTMADFDEDGDDDLYTTDFGPNHVWLWDAPTSTWVDDDGALGLDLGFSDVGSFVSWGAVVLDLDRDGRIELAVATGSPNPHFSCEDLVQPDFLFRSAAPGVFDDVSAAAGLAVSRTCAAPTEPLDARAFVPADLDGDGDDDLVLTPHMDTFAFYRNDTDVEGRRSLRVRPHGTVSPREATGSSLTVELADGRTIRRRLEGGMNTSSQGDRLLEVGLDASTAEAVVEARLEWPGGLVQRLDLLPGFADAIARDGAWTITEPAWLTISTRTIAAGDAAELVYTRTDATGAPAGVAGAGADIRASAQVRLGASPETVGALPVEDRGDGTYRIVVPHGGQAGSMRVTITDPARAVRIAPVLRFE